METRTELATQWLDRLVELLLVRTGDVFPSSTLLDHIPDLIAEIAEYLRLPAAQDISANTVVMQKAAQLGALRFTQRATVHQLLREYQILGDLLEEFLGAQVLAADPPLPGEAVLAVMRRVTHAVRVLQQQTIDTFTARHTAALERQNLQLLAFARLVGHEMRQPLGVLQVLPGVIPIRAGDMQSLHLVAVFDRNVRRLADVATRLERLSHTGIEEAVLPSEQRTDLGVLVGDVVERLGEMARARDVHLQIDSELPVLELDPARAELVFTNLVANAIKYADPEKPARLVEVLAVKNQSVPTVIVRDNGIGIPAKRVQHIFREFVRAHAHRDRELGAHGLGLGLSIVRDSMDAAGGTVRVESVEGEGTTVTLTWPKRTVPSS
jgi:signal transduction histidine kinase